MDGAKPCLPGSACNVSSCEHEQTVFCLWTPWSSKSQLSLFRSGQNLVLQADAWQTEPCSPRAKDGQRVQEDSALQSVLLTVLPQLREFIQPCQAVRKIYQPPPRNHLPFTRVIDGNARNLWHFTCLSKEITHPGPAGLGKDSLILTAIFKLNSSVHRAEDQSQTAAGFRMDSSMIQHGQAGLAQREAGWQAAAHWAPDFFLHLQISGGQIHFQIINL